MMDEVEFRILVKVKAGTDERILDGIAMDITWAMEHRKGVTDVMDSVWRYGDKDPCKD
jgi:hypothetical protein